MLQNDLGETSASTAAVLVETVGEIVSTPEVMSRMAIWGQKMEQIYALACLCRRYGRIEHRKPHNFLHSGPLIFFGRNGSGLRAAIGLVELTCRCA